MVKPRVKHTWIIHTACVILSVWYIIGDNENGE